MKTELLGFNGAVDHSPFEKNSCGTTVVLDQAAESLTTLNRVALRVRFSLTSTKNNRRRLPMLTGTKHKTCCRNRAGNLVP